MTTATFSFDRRQLRALTCGFRSRHRAVGQTPTLESDTAELKSWSSMSPVVVSRLLNLSEPQFPLLLFHRLM